MPTFNASQQEAINAQNSNILVSAAAGSGKTTVMVEKIRETLLRHPEASISQFLVITFTRDAARNMKDKLRDLLEEAARDGSAQAARALSEIETAAVSTIHSFCTQLLREYNDNTGASMNPRVLKEAEKKRILDECFGDAAEQLLSRGSASPAEDRQAVSALLAAFGPEAVCGMVQSLYDVLMGIPDPMVFLSRVVQEPPVELWNREILNAVDLDVLGIREALAQEEQLMQCPEALPAYDPVVQEDAALLDRFLEAFGTAEDAAEKRALLAAAREGMRKAPSRRSLDDGTKAWKKQLDKVRDSVKGANGILAAAAGRIDDMLDEDNLRLNAVIRQELRGLELLLRETGEQYAARKLEAGVIDYADMEQTAYRIMKDPEKREELLSRYRYIYVDECQDVSGIQDAIIKSLTGPGHMFFMVGDVKQSIYGFRHAEPELFEKDRRSYSDSPDARDRRIFFMDNYRSCASVVNAVNEVFANAMDAKITDMDYLEQDHLRCNLPGSFGPVDVMLVRKGAEDADKLEAQCEAAGRYIQSLLSPAGEGSSGEHYDYRDIVILLRAAKGTASAVVSHLRKMHIPAMYEGAPDFFSLAEVKAFLSLLTVIDNFHNDDALVGALINPPFLFTAEELAKIRLNKQERVPFWQAFSFCAEQEDLPIGRKCRRVLDQLAVWSRISAGMSVPDFVWWLMRDTGIYAARGAWPDGKARQANLDVLYQRAVDGQQAGILRLSDFIGSLMEDRQTKLADSDDHPVMGRGDHFVRVMTMHKSKGLEFPVVILLDLQRSIRKKHGDDPLRMDVSSSPDKALGLYLPAVRRTRSSKRDSQGKDAFDLRVLRSGISESTRLLYVAMTRAEKKLCLIGSFKDGEEALWFNQLRPARVWKTRSMLDMIMPAVLKQLKQLPESGGILQNGLWRLSCVEGRSIEESESSPVRVDSGIEEALISPAPMWMYLPEAAEPTPLKTSVTTLTRHVPVLSGEDSEETVADKRKAGDTVRTFRLSSVPSRPAFLEEEKVEAAAIGTASHRFMHLIRLEALRGDPAGVEKAVYAEKARMEAAGILSPEEAGMIQIEGAADFFRSPLGQRMLQSPDVRREAPFTMRIAPDAPTLVQGILDCAFLENGKWILIDYKTDRDTAEETFVPRHAMQMNWYRAALERLTHIPVAEMWLFALRAGKAFPVPRKTV